MKKVLLILTIAFLTNTVFGQKYDDIKSMLLLSQSAKAKEQYDKSSSNEKFFTKPEGYLIKAAIYSNLAVDSSKLADAAKNADEANQAFLKYKQMEPDMKLLDDPAYKTVPFNLYATYYNMGVTDINNKQYDQAYEKFVKTVDYSDLLISKKIMNKKMDTAAIYYAGILAENTKRNDDALKYYTRLSNDKIKEFGGTNYESVYQGLVRYYANKNDNANFEKYKALGKEMYPQSEFFTYNMIDFAVGGSSNFDEKVANLEKLAASNPNDYKTQLALGETIFETLNSRKEGAVIPANAAELEGKMLAALNKASGINPNELQPYLLLGDHFTTKSEKLSDEMRPVETDLIKKGAKATAADKQKLAGIKAKYDENYDLAKNYFEKAADIFGKMPSLDVSQKRQYKIIAGNLAQYYSYKRESAKGADLSKVIALEKKYTDIEDKLRK